MRSAESKRLDMLHGPIWSKLPQFALPVAATAILEQLFNASDEVLLTGLVAAFVGLLAVYFVSYKVCVGIYKRKEY